MQKLNIRYLAIRIIHANFLIFRFNNSKPMEHRARSIRPFIGAKDYEVSRRFYRELGFEEVVLSHNMSLFKTDGLGFYLQDAYVQDWIDNTMLFLEVEDVGRHRNELVALDHPSKYN